MPVDDKGQYYAPTSPKQDQLRALCNSKKKKFVLANGTRLSTKSIGCLFCVCDHAWEVENANIALITVTQGVGNDSGIWTDLTQRIIPERIDGNFGFEWVKEPFTEGVSKKPTCYVRNKHGQKVKIQLWSLKDEEEVERRFKGPRFSMIYVPELSSFHKEMTFSTWCECLRIPGPLGVKRGDVEGMPDDHIFLGDTNPADEGDESWIWRLWFGLLECRPEEAGGELAMKNALARMDFVIDDNIFDTKERLELLKSQYFKNKDLYDRYILGRWVQATTDAIFYSVFSEERHVDGERETPGNPDPLILVPRETSFQLSTGWDLGSRNCAVTFSERVMVENENGESQPAFTIFDEHVVVGQDFYLDEFTEVILDKKAYWEKLLGRVDNIMWTHWSDRNAFSVKDLSGRLYLNQAIYQASRGQITLQGAWDAQRGEGSVDARIDLTRKLLFEGRLLISRRCPKTIEMFKSLRRKKNSSKGIAIGHPSKHPFDSGSYIWCSEAYTEMAQSVISQSRKLRQGDRQSGLVQVSMR